MSFDNLDKPVDKPELTERNDRIPHDLEHNTLFKLVGVKQFDGESYSGYKGAVLTVRAAESDKLAEGKDYTLWVNNPDDEKSRIRAAIKDRSTADKVYQQWVWNQRMLFAAMFNADPESEQLKVSQCLAKLEKLHLNDKLESSEVVFRMRAVQRGKRVQPEYSPKGDN
jgi:hypothetical protein